ncbi:MAG: transposase [Bdellovibrionaceae bacterium]|nr:transposase [Pseudobdellovibrionaceae bacterium]
MPRQQIELSNIFPYHLCARTNNKDWFNVPLSEVCLIYEKILIKTKEQYGIQVHHFILMSNHFHMIASTPKSNLPQAMRYFMTETSRNIARAAFRINKIYGARYHRTIIKQQDHYAHTVSYLYRNSVRAQICQRVEDYPWSSLSNIQLARIMNSTHFFEVDIPKGIELLDWLNSNYCVDYDQKVKRALKKHDFKFGQDKNSGKKENFNHFLYKH